MRPERALAAPAGLTLSSLGRELVPGQHIGALAEMAAIDLDLGVAQQRLARDGYLLLRGFHPRGEVLDARLDVAEAMAADGLLDPAHPASETWARSGEARELSRATVAIHAMQRYMRLVAGARIVGLFSSLLGAPAMTFDHKWLRTVPPGQLSTTKAHCDIVYMGGGTQELFTVWTPLDDIALEMGPIMLVPGSHTHERVRATYGRTNTHAGTPGPFSGDALETARVLGGRWATAEFRMGDILVFGMHLYATPRSTTAAGATRLLSTDNRYQRADHAVDDRHMGEVERKIRPNLSQEWLAEFGGELGR